MSVFEVNDLLQASSERTGLSGFGPEDFMEGLEILVKGINTDVRVNPDRVDQLRERLLRLLMNRQWFAHDLEKHPEILEEDLGSPIVITSLPRTASTKLHRLLGASGAIQTPMMWETHMFARIPGLPDGGRERRIQETREYEKWIYQASPELITGHPVFTDEPEEDMMLSEFSFRHSFLQGILNSPTYLEWIATADMQPMYDYLAMQLKYLQWQHGDKGQTPWLLKTPIHFGAEQHLVRLFGSARFIVTHRDPVKCIPSIASTTKGWRELYTQSPKSEDIGKEHLQMFSYLASQHIAWRHANPGLNVLDLSFQEVTEDGMGTASKIFDFFDIPLTEKAERAMQQWEKDNARDKHGKHSYTAEQMGVTEQEIRAVFTDYLKRFSHFL
jgi:Sulfotransferase family